MPRPLPPIDLTDAFRRYQAGESPGKIAASIGISPNTFRRRLREAGIPRQRDRSRWIGRAIDLHLQGVPQGEIAAQLGLAQGSVSMGLVAEGYRTDKSAAERRKWDRMTPEQRAAQVVAAHDAVRGSVRDRADLERRARGKQRTQASATIDETDILEALAVRGVYGIAQQAVGKYNLDIGVAPVAVELFGGAWHAFGRHWARLPQRLEDIADAGFNQLIVWSRPDKGHPLSIAAVAQDVVTYVEASRSDPALRRQYRVIWGDGQFIAAGCVDDDQVTLVPPGVRRDQR